MTLVAWRCLWRYEEQTHWRADFPLHQSTCSTAVLLLMLCVNISINTKTPPLLFVYFSCSQNDKECAMVHVLRSLCLSGTNIKNLLILPTGSC